MSESGSIKMTASAPSPTEPSSVMAVTAPPASDDPIASKFRSASAEVSKPRTWYPAPTSRRVIGMPMFPSPMNPTVSGRHHAPISVSGVSASCSRTPPARSPIASTTRLLISSPYPRLAAAPNAASGPAALRQGTPSSRT